MILIKKGRKSKSGVVPATGWQIVDNWQSPGKNQSHCDRNCYCGRTGALTPQPDGKTYKRRLVAQNVFKLKMFLSSKCFWAQNFVEFKIFLGQNVFGLKMFSDSKCFWAQNFSGSTWNRYLCATSILLLSRFWKCLDLNNWLQNVK